MATRWETYPIKFEGGLITNVGRLEHGTQFPGSATVLQNYEPDVRNGYSKVLGYAKYSDTAVPGTGQIFGVVALSSTEALAVRSGNVYYSSGTSWTNVLTQTSGVILRTVADSFNFNGTKKTVLVDGVNAPSYFNHTTKLMAYAAAPSSDVVGASRVCVFKSHVFFAKGHLLSFSSPFLEEDFNPANGAGVINVGDTITGLIVFRDQLIVLCLNRIFRLSGNTEADFQLQPITNNTGCLCGFTVQEVGGDVMYLGPDGIRYLSASERENDFGLTRASEKIQKLVLDATNTNCFYSSLTIASKSQYRLFTFVQTTPAASSNGFLATKFSNQSAEDIAWATLKGFKVYDSSKHQGRDKEYVVFASDTDFVYSLEVGSSFDGEDIEAIFETPYMSINDPKIRKTFYKHTAYVRPSGTVDIGVNLKFDYGQDTASVPPGLQLQTFGDSAIYGDPSAIYGVSIYSSPSEREYFNNTVGSGFVVAVRYYDKSQGPTHNLNFAILEYRTNERR